MTPEDADNAVRSIAKKLLTELRSKDNHHTLRQLLISTPTKLSHYAHQVMKCGCCFAFWFIGWLRVNSRGNYE